MLYGSGIYNQQGCEQSSGNMELTWLDQIILTNPQGVMKVLSSYGYTGYLAPQDETEMYEVCADLISKHGDQATIDLLRAHPLYDVIAETSKRDLTITMPFKNAAGDSVITTIRTINYQVLLENALIILGAFYIASKLWGLLNKE